MTARISHRYVFLACMLAALIMSAPVARAFTLENADGSKADQSAGYMSAGSAGHRFEQSTTGKDGVTKLDLGGGTTMTIGRPRDNGPDYSGAQQRMFSPLRPGN